MNSTEYYLDRLISQHRGKLKFEAWIATIVSNSPVDPEYVSRAFDLEHALGAQLDIIGGLIGRARLLPFEIQDGSALMNDDIYRIVLKAKVAINRWDGTMEGLPAIWNTVFPDVRLYVTDNQDMSMTVTVVGLPSWFPQEIIRRHYVVPKPEGVRVNYEFSTIVETTLRLGAAAHIIRRITVRQVS